MIRFTLNLFIFVIVISESSGAPKSVARNLLKPDDLSGKIVGGVEATPHEFPWIVGFRKSDHHCGGTILNRQWILSAAHCFPSDVSEYSVVAGDHRNNENEGTEQHRTLERIIRHPEYFLNENDLALIKVSVPFEFNEYVQAADLVPADFTPSEEDLLLVAGWGGLIDGGKMSEMLMKVEVPLVPHDVCSELYGGSRIKDTMMCGGLVGEGGKDACKGDSGGPLLCMDGDKRTLCGVVAFGTGCARPDRPGVYTKIWPYYEWILSTFKQFKEE